MEFKNINITRTNILDIDCIARQLRDHKHRIADITDFPISAGNNGKILAVVNNVPTWIFNPGLPSFTGNAGKYLTTDGNEAIWQFIPVQQQADWDEVDNLALSFIKNKPYIPQNTSDLVNDSGYVQNTLTLTINGISYSLAFDRTWSLTTTDIPEGNNLYYTDGRVRAALSLTTSGNNGSATYNSGTGAFNIPTYTLVGLGGVPLTRTITINGITYDLDANRTWTLTTSDIAEGSNLYYTDARVRAALSFISGAANYNSTTGVISIPTTTSHISEGSNLYYTDARVLSYGNTQWVQLDGAYSNPIWITDLAWSKLTGTPTSLLGYGILDAYTKGEVDTLLTGYLLIANFNSTFDARLALKTTSDLAEGSNLYFTTSRARTSLSFSAGSGAYNSTTGVITIPTDNNQIANSAGYITTIGGINAGGELSGTYPNPTLVNSAVIGKVLTGLNVTGGTVLSTDSILTAFGKVQNQINSLLGGDMWQGVWNATTNTPTITSSVGTKGHYYVVNVAGSTNIDGITDWKVGDWIIFNGATWDKVDNTDAVSSVNGQVGAVSLTTANIPEVTNLYYTDVRARAAVSATGTGLTYNSSTGVFTWTNPGYITAESDTLASVTARGASTSTALAFNGGFSATSGTVTGGLTIQPSGDATLTVRANSSSNTARILFNNGASSIWALFKDSTVSDFRLYNYSLSAFAWTVAVGTNNVTFNNNITAANIIRSGGTSSQFLKADGSVDSSVYLTSYTETDPIYVASSWYSTTNNSTNWNTAFSQTRQWDGGATGLVAATGRTSLGLGTMAVESASNYYTTTQIQNFFSGASAMTGYNKSDWDDAYGWGNHAGLYSLLGHTHTFSSLTSKPTTLVGYGITDAATSAQGTKADTAYSWGDHSLVGYFLASNFNSSFDTRLALKSTTDLAEGINLYYTQGRFDSAFALKSTTNLAEGINLYYTAARFNTAFAAKSTSDLSEGTNLYYTDARVLAYGDTQWVQLDGLYSNPTWITTLDWSKITSTPTTLAGYGITDGVRSVSGTAGKIFSSGGINPILTIDAAYIGQSSISNVGTITIGTWNGAAIADTYISSASNWNAAYSWGNHALAGYLTTISGIAAGGELAGTYANPTLVNSAVTGKLLSGVNITGGTILATDSILTAFGKVQNQINSLVGGMQFVDFWNATTNSPAIPTAVGNKGKYYIVQTAGTTSIDGITDWQIGDWVVSNGTTWGKIDNTDAVVSVNGFTGAVSLTTANIPEVTNLYYTDVRARAALSSSATGLTYNSTTGVFSLTSGYVIPTTTQETNWTLAYTQTRQWDGGATGLNAATGRTSLGLGSMALENTGSYYTQTQINSFFSGGTAITGYDNSNWNTAYNNRIATFSTTGNSGAATFSGNVLNIPTYTLAGLGGQPLDADLTAIAALAGTSGLLRKTAADTWSLDTNTYLTGNQNISLSGDASGSGTTSIAVTLATVNSNVGTYGNSTTVPTLTVNAKGLITAVSQNSIPTSSGSITGLLSSTDWTTFNNKQAAYTNLTTIGALANTNGFLRQNGAGVFSYDTNTYYLASNPNGYITGNQTITLSGHVTGSGATSISTTIANGVVTTAMMASANISQWTNDSGYITSASVGNGTLTMNVSGNGLSGSQTFTANQSGAATFTVASNATSANTGSTIVFRDASGNFSAGTITAALSGNAATSDYTDFLLSQGSILTSQLGVAGSVYYSSAITYPQTGLFPASDNSNSILTLNRHSGDYYSQLGFSSDANIYYRRFSATAINTTQPWIALVQNSGTWSISITGDANTVDGFHASQSTVANNVVVRDPSGYIFGTYINMTDDGNPGAGTSISSFITKQGDNYYRSVSPTNAMTSIRGVANGTWGIDIAGQAGYLQLQSQGSGSVSVASGVTAIYRSETGNGAVIAYAPVLHVGGGDTRWQLQGSYGTGNGTLYFREGMNGVYGSWLTVLTNANFNSYALPLTAGSGNVITGSLYINSSIFTSNATYLDIYNNTSDGADTKITRIGGGGDVTNNRGANIDLRGNEAATGAGNLYLNAGGSGTIIANATLNGTSAAFINGSAAFAINATSHWTSSAPNNPIITFGRAGSLVAGAIGYDDNLGSIYVGTTTAHSFLIKTNNSTNFAVTSGGNTLIKTTTESPNNEALQVAGRGLFTGGLTATSTTAGALTASITNNVTSASATTGYGLAINSEASASTSYALTVRNLAGSSTYMHILTETGKVGWVGFGTTSPSTPFHVASGAATFSSSVTASGFSTTSTSGISINNGDGVIDWSSGLRFRVFISGTGYVTPLTLNNTTGAAQFSGTINSWGINVNPVSVGTSPSFIRTVNTGGDIYFGIEGSTNGGFFTGSTAYATVFYGNSNPIQFILSGTKRFEVNTSGVSVTGTGTFSSSVVASVFNGAGTGLTGYASSLNIGGYSGYTNFMYAQSLGTASMNINNPYSGVYRNENGNGGNLRYAPVLHLSANDTQWQIQGDYYNSSTLQWRAGYAGTWYAWRNILHSGNYNSYSPTLEGTGATGDWDIGSRYLYTTGNMLTELGSGKLYYTSAIASSTTGLFPTGDNSNGIITLNRHPGAYYSQLGFNSTGNMYYRHFNAVNINDSNAWQLILHLGNSPYAYNMNQYVRTTDNVTFNQVTATLIGISSGVVINYNNDSASTYQMLWGSGNYVYGTAGIYCNPSTDTIYANGNIIAYASSDSRYKDNQQLITNPIGKLLALRGMTFTWNNLQQDFKGDDYGLIYQDVVTVMPEITQMRANGYGAIKYEKVIPLLVEVGKNHEERIKELESKLQAYENKFGKLN